ncbi:16S rRNA (adenine(1518)-N(6)/adenine(1519)-N(6))-dimethyltransferase RsmA [Pseudorhodoplanes sp.]|uniref:16S rRNA (adenine(1518)-N(6)/adenine(1519)-N(6))- dimethyltransferase RsmA n=1 Tax=Pseudorhodoplanes sp. TaxID=1934341 RepID=UPI00391D0B6B
MAALDDLPPLRDVIRKHELTAKKSLGQNFLLDLNLTGRIARAAGPLHGVTVIEIGPGPGGLTRALLMHDAARIVAVERDARAVGALQEIAQRYPGRLTIVEGDALTFDPAPFLHEGPVRIVANLPYNIATVLLTGWLEAEPWPPFYERLVLMFQREVAERIVAAPNTKAYGRLSVLAQWRTKPKILFDVAPSAFVPPPKVTSSVVEFVPRPAPDPCDRAALTRVAEAAFGQRRKMLRQSLKTLVPDPLPLLETAAIAPTDRAEDIPVEGFVRLARAYSARA